MKINPRPPALALKKVFVLIASVLLWSAVAWSQFVPTATTLTGETYQGSLSLDTGAFVHSPGSGNPVRIDPTNLLTVALRESKPGGQGVMLKNGTTLRGKLTLPDPGTIQVEAGGVVHKFPAKDVARIVFASKAAEMRFTEQGVLFPNGDFMAGEVRGITAESVRINSPILGFRRFNTKEIAAVVLQPSQNHSRFVVVAVDGSEYAAGNIRIEKTGVETEDPTLGRITVPAEKLARIEAGNERLLSLTRATPTDVRPAPGLAANRSYSVDKSLDGGEVVVAGTKPAQSVCVAAGAGIAYAVPPGAASFIAEIALPEGAAPDTQIRVNVFLDGKSVLQSPVCAPGEAAKPIRVPLFSARQIAFVAESANGNTSIGRPLVLLYPSLVKR